jgi:hypothetical protein
LANQVPSLAQSIGFGIGDTAESAGDTRLQFEVARKDINLVSFDFVNDVLIFKASLPENFVGSVYEVGLFSLSTVSTQSEFGSKTLATFDSATETWVDATSLSAGTFTTTNTRIGTDSLSHTPAANGTKTDALKDVVLDLSGYSSADQFSVALNNANTYTSSVNLKFMTDANNYYQINLGTPGTGYRILTANKGAAVATGTPSWGNITEIRVTTNATAGGSPVVNYDGIRIEDADNISSDSIMVSREKLLTPFISVEGMTQEIEFSLDVIV